MWCDVVRRFGWHVDTPAALSHTLKFQNRRYGGYLECALSPITVG